MPLLTGTWDPRLALSQHRAGFEQGPASVRGRDSGTQALRDSSCYRTNLWPAARDHQARTSLWSQMFPRRLSRGQTSQEYDTDAEPSIRESELALLSPSSLPRQGHTRSRVRGTLHLTPLPSPLGHSGPSRRCTSRGLLGAGVRAVLPASLPAGAPNTGQEGMWGMQSPAGPGRAQALGPGEGQHPA